MLSLQNSKTFSSGKEDKKGQEGCNDCKGATVLLAYS